jgi:hypothetical protein
MGFSSDFLLGAAGFSAVAIVRLGIAWLKRPLLGYGK